MAQASRPKAFPASLRWIQNVQLPVVRWLDGSPLDEVVWHGWVQQAVKTKQVEPSGHLRMVAAELDANSARGFAVALLKAWIAQDLAPRSAEAIADIATTETLSRVQAHAANPSLALWDPMYGKSHDEILALITAQESKRPIGSASSSRGLLAIVAALGGPGVADPVARYLNSWAGRSTQAKALIGLLAQVDDPAALQLLVALPNRLRTSGLAKEARIQVAELANRLGMTVEELADRAVPDAGLDANGELVVSYGPRSFVVRLNDDLTWAVRDEAGKVLRGLPQPRVLDDPEAVVLAKAAVATAKSEVKDVVKLQTPRLRDHMTSQRVWTVSEWNQQIATHPVLSRLGRRLVWVAEPGGSFRPLDDGTFTDVNDSTVDLASNGHIRLAHSTSLTADIRRAWMDHLADYEVISPFDQLGTDPVVVSNPNLTQNTDYLGWVLDAFGLRNQTMRRGYRRGEPGSAGVFVTYEKEYPTAWTTAVIGFSGSYLPEQPRPVALTTLRFRRGERWLRFSEVAPAVLTESWADMAAISASGSGFDPNWETTTRL